MLVLLHQGLLSANDLAVWAQQARQALTLQTSEHCGLLPCKLHEQAPASPIPIWTAGQLQVFEQQARQQKQQVQDRQSVPVPVHLVLPMPLMTPAALLQLRTHLLPIDDESYAFVPVPSGMDFAEFYARYCPRGDAGMLLPMPALTESDPGLADLVQQMRAILFEKIELHEPDPDWPSRAQAELSLLRAGLQTGLLPAQEPQFRLEHIGSTALPQMPAKPILDFILGLPDFARWRDWVPALRSVGYELLEYPQNTQRIFLRKGRPRRFHLHIVQQDAPAWQDHIDFRDALLSNPARALAYAGLKRQLAGQFAGRRALYGQSKGQFIKETLAEFRGA